MRDEQQKCIPHVAQTKRKNELIVPLKKTDFYLKTSKKTDLDLQSSIC